ncbi:MAG: segregation/condensation protein A [Patescibacteria group bacterium]|nr:segregation/condensation protein A [Patescibacteria group bacterium]
MRMTYQVKTEQFEGPLDLLLSLIEKEEVDITRVSLARITDQYLAYINEQEDISLYNLTDFLSVAAKLILVKSHALLPLLQLDDEEEEDLQELEKQLAALKVFKDHSETFAQFFEDVQSGYSNKGIWGQDAFFCPHEDITVDALRNAFLVSLHTIPRMEALEEQIVSDVISLERRIVFIQKSVQQRATIVFSEITINATDRSEVVISFLALLELVKQQIIVARQKGIFDDIVMKNESVNS